jgi:hypothetical protein
MIKLLWKGKAGKQANPDKRYFNLDYITSMKKIIVSKNH